MGENTFESSLYRKTVKWTFVCSNIFFVFASLVLTIYLYSYTVHSNACDGQDITNLTCTTQIVDEGYKGTQALVDGNLLPRNWTKITAGAKITQSTPGPGGTVVISDVLDAQGNPTYHPDHFALCEWNSNVER